jgi:ribonuclease P protein component
MHKVRFPRALFSFTSYERKKLLFQARTVYRENGLEIRTLPHNRPFSRILIITPKKMGTAPQRNLMRRRIKALFYEEKLFEKKFDVTVYCTKESTLLSFQDIKHSLVLALNQAQKQHGQTTH